MRSRPVASLFPGAENSSDSKDRRSLCDLGLRGTSASGGVGAAFRGFGAGDEVLS